MSQNKKIESFFKAKTIKISKEKKINLLLRAMKFRFQPNLKNGQFQKDSMIFLN